MTFISSIQLALSLAVFDNVDDLQLRSTELWSGHGKEGTDMGVP